MRNGSARWEASSKQPPVASNIYQLLDRFFQVSGLSEEMIGNRHIQFEQAAPDKHRVI